MTIDDLKKHCIKTIKMSEAIESIPNVRVTDNRSLQEHKMVLKLIEAWEKVKEEIGQESDYYKNILDKYPDEWFAGKCRAYHESLEIIDKHLSEVSE